ncbi:MAG TPA: hypothetical protein VMT79_21540 [Candidatus Binatia bacterium]|nr:hypothetical protein [Candidatus Binatia bacterium]
MAVVRDLFFVARIRETGRLVETDVVFAREPDEIALALAAAPADLVIVDLTTPGADYEAVFSALERAPRGPVLGYTTHVLARQTQPWHRRCDRVVTKEMLTRDLAAILREGITGHPAATEVRP